MGAAKHVHHWNSYASLNCEANSEIVKGPEERKKGASCSGSPVVCSRTEGWGFVFLPSS